MYVLGQLDADTDHAQGLRDLTEEPSRGGREGEEEAGEEEGRGGEEPPHGGGGQYWWPCSVSWSPGWGSGGLQGKASTTHQI